MASDSNAPDEWLQAHVVSPARKLIDTIAEGESLLDLRSLQAGDGLSSGLEGLFRRRVGLEYARWPHGATTDGFIADMCRRAGPRALEIIGMCFIDFDGERFPLRFEVELSSDLSKLARLSAAIGDVEPQTGAPPRLPPGSTILIQRDLASGHVVANVVRGRRLVPIEWTNVLSIA